MDKFFEVGIVYSHGLFSATAFGAKMGGNAENGVTKRFSQVAKHCQVIYVSSPDRTILELQMGAVNDMQVLDVKAV